MKYFLCFLSLFFVISCAKATPLYIQTKTETIVLNVEIADTPETRATGLMNRDLLPENHGMLFLFETETQPQFWMKNTKISLDMIFIGNDGLIKGIHENAIPEDLTPITAPEPIISVLEIAGGATKKLNISAGDKVIYNLNEKDLKSE